MPPALPAGAPETLVSRCRFLNDDRLVLGRVTLTVGEMRLRGWRRRGRVSLRVPLFEISDLVRSADSREPMLEIGLRDGTRLVLGISAPGLWRWAIRMRLPAGHPLSAEAEGPELPAMDGDGDAAASRPFRHRVFYESRGRTGSPSDRPPGSRQRWRHLGDLVSR